MADTNNTEKKKPSEELYEAFKEKNKYVAWVSDDQPPKDPLQRISNAYNSTFLHLAIRFKQKDLVNELLGILSLDHPNQQLSVIKNNEGNTILHEVACSDSMKDVAEKVLKRCKAEDPKLLTARNGLGETPVFCAARYGQTEMFKFLAEEMKLKERSEEDVKLHLQRNDETTVLHFSIFIECFELAYFIAHTYPCLIKEKDEDSMTALQYLACNPIAFGRKMKMGQGVMTEIMISLDPFNQDLPNIFKKIFNKCTGKKDNGTSDSLGKMSKTSDESCSRTLQRLIKLLVEKDTSWHDGGSKTKKESEIEEHSSELSQKKDGQESQENGQNFQENEGQNSNESKKSDESPLFLATMSNIQEIVKEILVCHPQMLEHPNKEGMNILQVAILCHHGEIFEMLVKHKELPRSLLSAKDKKENSLLHMVSQKKKGQASERMQNPAFQLRKELLLFQKVKSACKMHLTRPLNKDHQTAEELFAASNEKLHQEAKEWLMRASENCTILSVFIATVAFAAAYTVPGGSDGSTGIPILHSKPFFKVFIIADVISLTFALTSVGIFLSILTSSFLLEDFENRLFKKLTLGIKFMVFSISMMAVGFGATIVLIMTHNWESVVWYVGAFLPVPIFFISYSPLRSAVLTRSTELFKKFVPKILKVVGIVVAIFPFVLFYLPYKACQFIICKPVNSNTQSPQPTAAPLTVLFYLPYKACQFIICKPVRWICGNKSQPNSNTQSPQPTAAPLTVLFYLPYKACQFIICKPVRWICGNKSQPNSNTQSPQPTAAPLPEV